jgi:hypothetical protein
MSALVFSTGIALNSSIQALIVVSLVVGKGRREQILRRIISHTRSMGLKSGDASGVAR